jgi:phospholipase C
MTVISPWSRGGWVDSQVFDHTSIGMFLERRFGITVESISPWHRAVCGDLTSAFDFVTPNDSTCPTLPDVSDYAKVEAQQRLFPPPVPPLSGPSLFQETGTRLSRALPYELHTSARIDASGTELLTFSNTGRQGAVFHVYDKLHLDRIPRRYTVEAGKILADSWDAEAADDGAYRLWVYGINGFVRSFEGSTRAYDPRGFNPETQICYEPCQNQIFLKVHNNGVIAGTVTVQANAYRSDGPWTLMLARAETGVLTWDVSASGNWYDFSVKATNFERRFAGRLETAQHSISDPAMAQHLSG